MTWAVLNEASAVDLPAGYSSGIGGPTTKLPPIPPTSDCLQGRARRSPAQRGLHSSTLPFSRSFLGLSATSRGPMKSTAWTLRAIWLRRALLVGGSDWRRGGLLGGL